MQRQNKRGKNFKNVEYVENKNVRLKTSVTFSYMFFMKICNMFIGGCFCISGCLRISSGLPKIDPATPSEGQSHDGI